jgi:hypothetical protein
MSLSPFSILFSDSAISFFRHETAEKFDFYIEFFHSGANQIVMLLREYRSGRENRRLLAVHHRFENGAERDFRLSVADVAAQKPVHYFAAFHIALDFVNRGNLVVGFGKLEVVLEFFLPRRVGGRTRSLSRYSAP